VIDDWLTRLEGRLGEGGEDELAIALVALAYAAGEAIEIAPDERRAAGRRALLLLAAGGDPARGLALDGRAVCALAADLDDAERRSLLGDGLAELDRRARGRPHISEALRALREDPEVAWRAYAAAILAEELEGELGDDGSE
jgi:hypothetical protein